MILSFKTHWKDGNHTFFIEKIWKSLTEKSIHYDSTFMMESKNKYFWDYKEKFKTSLLFTFNYAPFTPKKHTIRKGSRWKAGMKIHFAINSRSKDYFQFAPTVTVKSVQEIKIIKPFKNYDRFEIIIDGSSIFMNCDASRFPRLHQDFCEKPQLSLVRYDGFDTFKDFIDFFFPNDSSGEFVGQIIHWTDTKY